MNMTEKEKNLDKVVFGVKSWFSLALHKNSAFIFQVRMMDFWASDQGSGGWVQELTSRSL